MSTLRRGQITLAEQFGAMRHATRETQAELLHRMLLQVGDGFIDGIGPFDQIEVLGADGAAGEHGIRAARKEFVGRELDRNGGDYVMTPFGHLAPGNPYEAYIPPA